MTASTRRGARRTMTLWFIVGLLGILVTAPSALGQAAVDQYIPDASPGGGASGDPGTSDSGTPGEASLGSQGAGISVSEKTSSGSTGGGELPGTDYPITPFVGFLIGLIALALAAKFLVPALRQRRESIGEG